MYCIVIIFIIIIKFKIQIIILSCQGLLREAGHAICDAIDDLIELTSNHVHALQAWNLHHVSMHLDTILRQKREARKKAES